MRHAAFAEFYRLAQDTTGHASYQNACGDRSVLLLDGRERRESHHSHAIKWARAHGFDGYRLCRGTFTNPFFLTAAVIRVTKGN